MQQQPPPRLPANLESAIQRVRMAARAAAERTVDGLGLAAMACNNVYQRDSLLGAQFELNRKLAIFALTFNDSLDASVAREASQLTGTTSVSQHDTTLTNWDALQLVDDHEVELHITAERFALEISHACEWEIRELDGYVSRLLGLARTEHERNPLRAELIGAALVRAVEAVADRADARKVLGTEIGHALAGAMRQTYADIVADLRGAGVKPIGMSANQPRRTGPGRLDGAAASALQPADAQSQGEQGQPKGQPNAEWHDRSGAAPLSAHSGSGRRPGFGPAAFGRSGRTAMGHVDPLMMSVIRRLSLGSVSADEVSVDSGFAPGDTSDHGQRTDANSGFAHHRSAMVAPNLIHAHRDELHRAARNGLDQMVIDVVATLFDHILSDAKVPPQMARLIARLQLPVLRAALGDPTFFSVRRHPVRRLVNRIASLGAAADDLDNTEGQALLQQVQGLVQQIVDGDFEQLDIYEQTLSALEAFATAQARAQVQANSVADQVLARKEDQIRVQQRFAQALDGALADLAMADYLRDFLAQTWSRVIASAEMEHGLDSAQAQRMREAGRELVMSVQPKGLPAQRKVFLQQLPQLMKDLNAGMDRVRWPDESRRNFFAKLLPAHAESLRGQPMSTLEHNLLARRIDDAMATPLPQVAELPPAPPTPPAQGMELAEAPVVFTPAEAQAVGLVDESQVDWRAQVDIELDAEPEVSADELAIAGMPAPEPVEPSRGASLADHVQIGFAYQMHLDDRWCKVRLTHVSAGRTFFVFSHGAKQRQTVSMTYRMLARLCQTNRLRAFESAFLIERATARARRQLAQLRPAA